MDLKGYDNGRLIDIHSQCNDDTQKYPFFRLILVVKTYEKLNEPINQSPHCC